MKNAFFHWIHLIELVATLYIILEQLLASCVPHFMHRHELMCIFGEVYQYVAQKPYGVTLKLPPGILDELAGAMVVTPIAFASLRWPVAAHLAATDATPAREGAVSADIPDDVALHVHRFWEQRRVHKA